MFFTIENFLHECLLFFTGKNKNLDLADIFVRPEKKG